MSTFKLAIEDTVKFPVKFELKSNDVKKTFKFFIIAKRTEQSVMAEWLKKETEKPVLEIVKEVVTGWADQTLVVDEDGQPVKFSEEAFDALLGVPGVSNMIFATYLKESVAKEKN